MRVYAWRGESAVSEGMHVTKWIGGVGCWRRMPSERGDDRRDTGVAGCRGAEGVVQARWRALRCATGRWSSGGRDRAPNRRDAIRSDLGWKCWATEGAPGRSDVVGLVEDGRRTEQAVSAGHA